MQHLAKQWRGRNKNKLKPANRLKMNIAKTNRPKKEKKNFLDWQSNPWPTERKVIPLITAQRHQVLNNRVKLLCSTFSLTKFCR